MSLPLTKAQTQLASAWLKENFEPQIKEIVQGTPWSSAFIRALICKETAPKWIRWIDNYAPDVILARCVFDTSGEPEFPQSPRLAFPKNRDVFRLHYGSKLTTMLVEESNRQRAMPQAGDSNGWNPAPYLAKGYGILQYDLQHIVNDRAFFENKLWYSFNECLVRAVKVLNQKVDEQTAATRYNGSGAKAVEYGAHIMQLKQWQV